MIDFSIRTPWKVAATLRPPTTTYYTGFLQFIFLIMKIYIRDIIIIDFLIEWLVFIYFL